MRRLRDLIAATFVLVGSFGFAEGLNVGDQAPNWTLPGSDGSDHTLADLRGQHVVISFFPKASTYG